jgi:hypothetical protein
MEYSRTDAAQGNLPTTPTELTEILVIKYIPLSLFGNDIVCGKRRKCLPISTGETFFVDRETINEDSPLSSGSFREISPF